jgi:hypothetical protein
MIGRTLARPQRHSVSSDDAPDALLGDTNTAEDLSVLIRQIQKRLGPPKPRTLHRP